MLVQQAELTTPTATSTSKMLTTVCIYLFLVYAAAVLLYPVIFTRQASFCVNQDNLHQAYPFFNKLTIALHKGYLPVWDANTFCGKSFAGEIQPGIFYPVNLIWCLLFGSINGINVYYVDLLTSLHFLICLLGMYKLARTFQLPPIGAIASALVFTFTSAVGARSGGQTGIFFGLTLLPWSVYFAVSYYLVRKHKGYLLLSGLIAGMEILAGHMQPFFHTMIIIGLFILYYESRDRKSWTSFAMTAALNLFIILLVVAIITFPQMYYSAQYLSNVYRSVSGGVIVGPGEHVSLDFYTHRSIINLYNLPNLLGKELTLPDDDNTIYMGVLPLVLFVTYLLRRKFMKLSDLHARLTPLLIIILLIGVVSVLGYITPIPLLLHKLPFVPVVRQLGRYVILISFSASLFVGLAITYLAQIREQFSQRRVKIKQYVLIALCCELLYLMITQKKYITISVWIPLLLTFFFLMALTVKKMTNLAFLAVAIICIDLYFNKVNYAFTGDGGFADRFYARNRIIDTLEKTYGKYRVAFESRDYAYERRNLGDIYNIQTQFGYCATYNKPFLDFLNTDARPNSKTNDFLNIRYIITDKVLDSTFIFKDSTYGMNLYERRNYYPRIYWQHQIGLRGPEIESANAGSIRQLEYSDLSQKIDVNCKARDTLIISENIYPGWKCYDNQQEIPIRPAKIKNYPPLFRSVVLEKGHHIIEFKYNKVFHWF